MELGERKLQILQAIIDDFIISAEPVGSRTIAKKYGMGISSATIRNEMADLEEMGYLEQPHTSSGRIPSDKAYRLYVDRLMKVRALSPVEAESIKRIYDKKIRQIEQVIVQTTKILSEMTNYTSVVIAPVPQEVLIRHIQLVPIDTHFALVVVVTNTGIIKDSIVMIPDGMDSDYLNRISNILNEKLRGKNLRNIGGEFLPEIHQEFLKNRKFFNSLVDALTESLSTQEQRDVYLGGTSNIFNFPEYQDILKAKAFLSLMEEKELLYNVLTKSTDEGVTVTIGAENEVEEMKECSIVTATYHIGDKMIGTIGIIGPTRMEYSKAVSVMDYMGKTLSAYLTRLFTK